MIFQVPMIGFSVLGLLVAILGPGRPAGATSATVGRPKDVFYPTGLAIGKIPNPKTSLFKSFTLTQSAPVATIDYGYEIAGYPFFEVTKLKGKVQIEVKYTEPFAGLLAPYGDGPWVYTVGLSNTWRVETFEVTQTGILEAFLLQGGQRWQSIRLLTPGSITFGKVGFRPSIDVIELDELPGYFSSDNKLLNNIWNLGARAVQAACFSAGTQRAIWEVSKRDGAFVRGMRTALSTKGQNFSDYTLTFYSKIVRGGTGWAVSYPIHSFNGGIQLNLVGELPESTSFVNTNRTLTPPNTLVLGYGWTPFVNQTTLTSYRLQDTPIPFPIREGQWYKISTTIGANKLQVSINDRKVLNTSMSNYWQPIVPAPSFNSDTFGFGGYQDQSAYIKDVTVTGPGGKLLYSNKMTDEHIFEEYGVHENYASVCLDGPKRDRLVWLGDFFHTARIIAVTTSRWDYVIGTLRDSIAWQSLTTGLFPISQTLGYPSSSKSLGSPSAQANLALVDYQLLGFIAFYTYVEETGDLDFVRETWEAWQLQLEFLIGGISNTTGLASFETVAFIGPAQDGSAVSCAMVQTLKHASELASAINDTSSAGRYLNLANVLAGNINIKLWNDQLGVYSTALADPGNYSVAGISFCTTSGVASPSRAQKAVAALSKLKLGPGYKDASGKYFLNNGNVSPNVNGFLLSALMESNHSHIAAPLIESLWGAMVTNDTTTTGASWEYVSPDGQPGLGLFTSLSHPWGGAATYILTKYVAGISPAKWGYKRWSIRPNLQFGVQEVKAGVETPFGKLGVEWKVHGRKLAVKIWSPKGTRGQFILGNAGGGKNRAGSKRETVVEVEGGRTREFTVDMLRE